MAGAWTTALEVCAGAAPARVPTRGAHRSFVRRQKTKRFLGPNLAEWQRAQDPEHEEQPIRHRITRKRPVQDAEHDGSLEARQSTIPRTDQVPFASTSDVGPCWWHEVSETSWGDKGDWAAVEIQIEMPESSRGFKRATASLSSYFVVR